MRGHHSQPDIPENKPIEEEEFTSYDEINKIRPLDYPNYAKGFMEECQEGNKYARIDMPRFDGIMFKASCIWPEDTFSIISFQIIKKSLLPHLI